jgi:hypothetical protein
MSRKRIKAAAWVALAGLVAGCLGKGEGSGDDRTLRDGRNGPGAISTHDTNSGHSGTGSGDTASPAAGPRQSSDMNK